MCVRARLVELPTGAVLVQLGGELDVAAASSLRDRLERAVRSSPRVVVDLRDVEFFDCSALAALLWAQRACGADEGCLVLVAPPRAVQRVLDAAGVDTVFLVRRDLRSGLQAAVAHAGTGA